MSLAADGLRVSFGGVVAVDDVTTAVDAHEVLAVVGPNGSGKTTLLNAITGLVDAAGRLRVDDAPLRPGDPVATRRAGILRTFQTPQIIDELSCIDNVLLAVGDRSATGVMAAWFGRPRMLRSERHRWHAATAALERFGLIDEATVPAGRLTYGQRRWLELARSAVAEPRYLLADEPSAGLNDQETERLGNYLRGLRDDGVGVVLVDHKVDFLRAVADRAIVLALGRVVADAGIAEVWELPAVRDAYLGTGRSRG